MTSAQERKTFSAEERAAIVARLQTEDVAMVAKEIGVNESTLYKWLRAAKSGKPAKVSKKNVSKTPSGRRVFSEKFKQAALKRFAAGESAITVARELGIVDSLLYAWRKAADGQPAPKTNGAKAHTETKAIDASNAVFVSVSLLKKVRDKIDVNDPVHMTAMLVLHTLQGKM